MTDVHDVPTTSSEDRQHELTRHCWCQPALYQMWVSMRPQQFLHELWPSMRPEEGLVVKHKPHDV